MFGLFFILRRDRRWASRDCCQWWPPSHLTWTSKTTRGRRWRWTGTVGCTGEAIRVAGSWHKAFLPTSKLEGWKDWKRWFWFFCLQIYLVFYAHGQFIYPLGSYTYHHFWWGVSSRKKSTWVWTCPLSIPERKWESEWGKKLFSHRKGNILNTSNVFKVHFFSISKFIHLEQDLKKIQIYIQK